MNLEGSQNKLFITASNVGVLDLALKFSPEKVLTISNFS